PIAGGETHDEGARRCLELELRTQSAFLDPDTFDLCGAFSCIDRWLGRRPSLVATREAALT
ncbi:MAG: hypothetical protein GWN84_03965, partial [Gammaproteobacteria bacterium]|nr:hypothetical protein [Gammaproteobacteria bacterium]NIR82166.1 hypothetical protein [Gammaproteobacteria bacterium]NIU03308.1 hypothetical protein [Gammaproteobacteria bacterium]NIV50803.1 hypothetical protein [Gammaproteobacteria bacterium]NIX84583.1 hypothetical protein [Gammaproteobacteria bacterium]